MYKLAEHRETGGLMNAVAGVAASAFGAMCTVMSAFASSGTAGTITTAVNSGAQQIWNILRSIAVPIAAVALAFNVFKMLFGSTREADAAKSRVIILVVAIALVFLAPKLVEEVVGWFAPSSAWGNFQTYN